MRFQRDVERTLQLQKLDQMVEDPPAGRQKDAGESGRGECRVDGYRRRLWRRVQDRIPQSSFGDRAVSGGSNRSGGYPPGYLHDGCKTDRLAEFASLRETGGRENAASAVGRG